MTEIANKLATYFEYIKVLEITSVIFTVFLSTIMCHILKRKISNLKYTTFTIRILKESQSLLYSCIFLFLFLITQIIFVHINKTGNLIYIGTSLSAAWFASSLIYLIADRKLSIWFILFIISPITLLHLLGIWGEIQTYLNTMTFTLGTFSVSLYRAIKSLIVLIVLFWMVRALLNVIDTHINKSTKFKKNERMLVVQLLKVLSYVGVFIISLQVIGIDLTVFAIFGGAIGVGIGFGLQKITSNFISGFILLFEKTLKVNDLIELTDGMIGFVRFTGARHTLVETYTGKEIMIPNEVFITQNVTNWTHSHKKARLDLKIGVSYQSDLRLVKELMLQAAKEHTRCAKDPSPSCYLEEFADSSVNFGLYFWIDDITEGRKTPKSDVLFSIWDKFKENNITIPFPQRDIHMIKSE
jgi:small-conductance mechanosensitive channel